MDAKGRHRQTMKRIIKKIEAHEAKGHDWRGGKRPDSEIKNSATSGKKKGKKL